jgi:hypothetical protein
MHVFLSPHADDIAYSLGGIILKNGFNNGMLVSIFQRSSHIPNVKSKASIEEGSLIRFKEDYTYAKYVGLDYQSLELPEAIDRDYDNFDAICLKNNYVTEPNRLEYECVIQSFLERLPSLTVVWVPLAIGHHIDHVIVNRAILNWKPIKKLKIIFYEDLPYAAYWGRTQLINWIKHSIGFANAELLNISDVFEHKMDTINIYQSQVNNQDTAGIKKHGLNLAPGFAMERIWHMDSTFIT